MERAGLKLKRTRERLKLTYREVEEASQRIAAQFDNAEFAIALSRLADIENKGTVPTIYRLYSLCAIYRLDFDDVLAWYGAPLDQLATVALRTGLAETHVFQIKPNVTKPAEADRPRRRRPILKSTPTRPPFWATCCEVWEARLCVSWTAGRRGVTAMG
jgi:transcriptional regulator with XRE-family HTH domain